MKQFIPSIVGTCLEENSPKRNRLTIADFPTHESPITTRRILSDIVAALLSLLNAVYWCDLRLKEYIKSESKLLTV